MRLVMAASVTRPVCCSCSGSGHHLECPPAVLQCAAAQQQQRDLAPTNSKQQPGAGSVAKSGVFCHHQQNLHLTL